MNGAVFGKDYKTAKEKILKIRKNYIDAGYKVIKEYETKKDRHGIYDISFNNGDIWIAKDYEKQKDVHVQYNIVYIDEALTYIERIIRMTENALPYGIYTFYKQGK